MDARSPIEADGMILVHLSDIPPGKRRVVADRVIRAEGLVGVPALDMLIAATSPRQDPSLMVTPEEYAKAMRPR